jgi:hypothetical protein
VTQYGPRLRSRLLRTATVTASASLAIMTFPRSALAAPTNVGLPCAPEEYISAQAPLGLPAPELRDACLTTRPLQRPLYGGAKSLFQERLFTDRAGHKDSAALAGAVASLSETSTQSALRANVQLAECWRNEGTIYIANPERAVGCEDASTVLVIQVVINGAPIQIGTMEIGVSQSVTFDAKALKWRHLVAVTTGNATEALVSGFYAAINVGCATTGSPCHSLTTPYQFPHLMPNSFYPLYFDEEDQAPAANQGRIDNLFPYLNASIVAPPQSFGGQSFGGKTLSAAGPHGRCDSKATAAGGCVNNFFHDTVLEFNAISNPAVKEVAAHVYKAQVDSTWTWPAADGRTTSVNGFRYHWGLPTGKPLDAPWIGNPLKRLMDSSKVTANRNAACPTSPGLPMECDEFPFATTYEGANECPPCGISTVDVPKSANDSQGGLMGGFYGVFPTQRILDGDTFWVRAVRADGSASW